MLAAQSRLALIQGHGAHAKQLLEAALAIYTHIGDRYSIAAHTANYGFTLLKVGLQADALAYLMQAAQDFESIGMHANATECRDAANSGQAAQ